MRITDLQTRLLTLAIIVLGAAAITVVTIIKPMWPHVWAQWPLQSRLSTAPLIFVVQMGLLLSINRSHSIYRLLMRVAIFCACIWLEGAILLLIDPRSIGWNNDSWLFPFIGPGLINFVVNWPSTALFAGLLIGVWLLNNPKISGRAFTAAMLTLSAFTFAYSAYRLITPLQRVLILTAIEDVKLYDIKLRSEMHRSIGTLSAGSEAVVSYCYLEKMRGVQVVPLPGNPKTLAFTGSRTTSFRTEHTGLFSRPRVLNCGDD